MAVRIVSKGLCGAALFMCVVGLLVIAMGPQALASGPKTVTITAPASAVVNTNNAITIYLNDTSGALINTVVTLSVTSPDSASTITSTVTTDATGHATATLHLSRKAGNNVITASITGASKTATVSATHDVPASLQLTSDHYLRLADGFARSVAFANLTDQYGNPVGGTSINFNIDGSNVGTNTTNSSGITSYNVGPFPATNYHNATVTASYAGINAPPMYIRFLLSSNIYLLRTPASEPVGSPASVTAVVNLDWGTPAVNIPLKFYAIDPDLVTQLASSGTVYTNSNGTCTFNFTLSQTAGDNTIQVTNSDLGGLVESTVIEGMGGDVSKIVLSTAPVSPIYADGTTAYTLNIWAYDSGNNPVQNKNLAVVRNGDVNYTISAVTNSNGYAGVNLGASRFVHDDSISVTAIDYVNNTTTYVTNYTTVSYRAGPATRLTLYGNPDIVASGEISTPPGMADVHQTDVIASVTDQWGHPIQGQTVTITSLNTTQANITNTYSNPNNGVTSDSGEFTAQFVLGTQTNGSDTRVGVPIRAVSGSLVANANILYTNNSFISVKSTINPLSNVSVNDTINVNVTLKAIGWKVRPQNYDVALIFDSSGSMDWLSSTVFPTSGIPESAVLPVQTHSSYSSGRWTIDARDWKLIDTFNNPTVQDLQFMLSSSYRNYSSDQTGTEYFLRVHAPSGNTSTDGGSSGHSSNENYVLYTNAATGIYQIYGAYVKNNAMGDAPYNMMVLTDPKRLGAPAQSSSAAVTASSGFIDNMTNSNISVIWFNVTDGSNPGSGVSKHLTLDNSVNKQSIKNAVLSLNANDGTNVSAGIMKAVTELTGSYSNSSHRKVAIILTDGYSQYPDYDIAAAATAASKNITIYTLGLGMPDSNTLGQIANMTGGYFTRVSGSIQLAQAYSDIANNLTDVAANKSFLHMMTNTSATFGPDTKYVLNSAHVTWPNGTVTQTEPTIVNNSTTYSLTWNSGSIRFNQTWNVQYQLKVLRSGSITPVLNQSYVEFWRADDGSYDTSYFPSNMLYANGTGNAMSNITSPLNMYILSPANGTPLQNSNSYISWLVTYTGSGQYYVNIYYNKTGDNTLNPILVNYGPLSGNMTSPTNTPWNTATLPSETYDVWAEANDGTYDSWAHVVTSIPYSYGQIQFQ